MGKTVLLLSVISWLKALLAKALIAVIDLEPHIWPNEVWNCLDSVYNDSVVSSDV